VKVQCVALRIARVLDRTPMSEPGGGKVKESVAAERV